MRYMTFSRVIGLTLCKTWSFSTILQWNLIFSLLTSLGNPIFKFYLLVRKTNFLWVVFSKIWMIRFFAVTVVNYMVRKFSFCNNFYVDVLHTFTFHTDLSIWKQSLFHKTWSWSYNLLFRYVLLYFTRNFSQRVSLLTSLMNQYILLRYITRNPTLEIQYSKILSGGISKN